MTDANWIENTAKEIAAKLHTCNKCELRRKSHNADYYLPSRKAIHNVLDNLMAILFPGCHGHGTDLEIENEGCIFKELKAAISKLQKQIEMSLRYQCEMDKCDDCSDCPHKAEKTAKFLLESLPVIQDLLQGDIQAAFEGDPAARSTMEVVMSYPAIQAIATYRIAHHLYIQGVPLIPRIMTELAHSRTGIDIHPGATIGEYFFIDHGTGVVIGETTTIGSHVKIYQGVTLGALSFPLDEDGKPVKGVKRHPDVQDNVTIYAEATILGGNTVIGEGSEIGGNVWLIKSVPPRSKVYNVQPSPKILSK